MTKQSSVDGSSPQSLHCLLYS